MRGISFPEGDWLKVRDVRHADDVEIHLRSEFCSTRRVLDPDLMKFETDFSILSHVLSCVLSVQTYNSYIHSDL